MQFLKLTNIVGGPLYIRIDRIEAIGAYRGEIIIGDRVENSEHSVITMIGGNGSEDEYHVAELPDEVAQMIVELGNE